MLPSFLRTRALRTGLVIAFFTQEIDGRIPSKTSVKNVNVFFLFPYKIRLRTKAKRNKQTKKNLKKRNKQKLQKFYSPFNFFSFFLVENSDEIVLLMNSSVVLYSMPFLSRRFSNRFNVAPE